MGLPGRASGDLVIGVNAAMPLAFSRPASQIRDMFTIEHDFDATVITLVDEGKAPLQEDVTLCAFEDCITLEQLDARTDQVQHITLSLAQARDLMAALDLPEGIYQVSTEGASDD